MTTTLDDLYNDPQAMPAPLLNAHEELDKVVYKLFGLEVGCGDGHVLDVLFQRYEELSGGADAPPPSADRAA